MHEGITTGSDAEYTAIAFVPWLYIREVVHCIGAMPAGHRDLLKSFGLSRNPFTDRTAEKTTLDGIAHYSHSDLQGFTPSGDFSGLPASVYLYSHCITHIALLPTPPYISPSVLVGNPPLLSKLALEEPTLQC